MTIRRFSFDAKGEKFDQPSRIGKNGLKAPDYMGAKMGKERLEAVGDGAIANLLFGIATVRKGAEAACRFWHSA